MRILSKQRKFANLRLEDKELHANEELHEATTHLVLEDISTSIQERFEDPRTLMFYEPVTEKVAKELIADLISYSSVTPLLDEEGNPIPEEPITLLINTEGGSLVDMFAIYDFMNLTKKKIIIKTRGFGCIMSAGLVLLGAGTKGHRSVSKNTRIMTHNVLGEIRGSFSEIENEYKEFIACKEAYIQALSDVSNMTIKEVKKMISGGKDVYLSPEEALRLGFIDFIEE